MSRFARLFVLLSTAALMAAADGPSSPAGPAGTAPAGQGGGGGMMMLIMPVVVLGIMYFLMIRPQRKEEAKRKELIAGLKRGDKVTTIGGAQGEVVAVGETTVDLDVGADGKPVVIRFTKGAVNASAVSPAEAAKGN